MVRVLLCYASPWVQLRGMAGLTLIDVGVGVVVGVMASLPQVLLFHGAGGFIFHGPNNRMPTTVTTSRRPRA